MQNNKEVMPVLFAISYIFTVVSGAILIWRVIREGDTTKSLEHGPAINLPEGNPDNGVIVGEYKKLILPQILQHFAYDYDEPIVIPYTSLSRGITMFGDMGTGKSRLMHCIAEGIINKYPDRPVLIHDPKAEWLRSSFNPETDLIYAPYDQRSCSWSLWKDLELHPELKHAIIATAVESHIPAFADKFWADSAIQLLKTALAEPSIELAKQYLVMKKMENQTDKTFQSVLSTAIIAFRDIATVSLSNKQPKTIDEFMQHRGRIFLLNNPSCAAEQKGAFALLLSAFMLRAISLPDVAANDLRAAVIIDEALTFHLPQDVETAVYSQSRSKGLCVVAGSQRVPNIHRGERGQWANQAAHIFGMRVSDLETRDAFSKRVGKIIYKDEQNTTTWTGGQKSNSSTTIERQHDAVSSESFGALQNREFILFHEKGIAPGHVINVNSQQQDDIQNSDYFDRKDVINFLRDF